MGKARSPLLQGTLDMLVLKTLTMGSMHGYAIARRIRRVTDDVLSVEEGSLYPSLHRMERKKWIESTWGISEYKHVRRAKYYMLTASGRQQLAIETEAWSRTSTAISQVLGAPALE